MSVAYLSVEEILAIQTVLLEQGGEDAPGYDRGCVEAVAGQPQQGFGDQDQYEGLAAKAAAYLYFVAANHCFTQANKRLAAACALVFLQRNGHYLCVGEQRLRSGALAQLTLDLVCKRCTLRQATAWFSRRIAPNNAAPA